ncbi:MAG: anhydro-N-acetylmuramic acid kinase [Bacteroidia bacterium]|nr:anhydro-N-acetylmuramic acid kinase [Bacteroidia bacterium]
MIKNDYKVIGVMSGTSLDGIDMAYITFTHDENWNYQIEQSKTYSYDEKWTKILQNLVKFSSSDLKAIDNKYTLYLSDSIKRFIDEKNIIEIDAICSHGHTALHRPEKGLTYQIGNQEILAKRLKKVVVCDFRLQDVKMGGQGAPLVPIGDEMLFSEYDFCLNLGGFGNISSKRNDQRIAYDICPVNIVLNHYVKILGLDYDDKGNIASTGAINELLFKRLNDLNYYKESFPKSLGLEWVREEIFPLIDRFNLDTKDVLRTFIEHIAFQISKETQSSNKLSMLITGGGVYNLFLINRIKNLTENNIVIPSNDIIEYKEALVFAFLGVLKIRNEINCLKSVTGAKNDHSSGTVFFPD